MHTHELRMHDASYLLPTSLQNHINYQVKNEFNFFMKVPNENIFFLALEKIAM